MQFQYFRDLTDGALDQMALWTRWLCIALNKHFLYDHSWVFFISKYAMCKKKPLIANEGNDANLIQT